MSSNAGSRVALGLAVLLCMVLTPASHGAERRDVTYMVPVSAGSADLPEQRQAIPSDLMILNGSGLPVALRRYFGNVVVLNFWASTAPPCFKEMVFLDRLQGDLEGQPLMVLALNEDKGGIADAKTFLTRQKLTFLKPFSDPGASVAQVLGVRGLPTTIVIDRKGRQAIKVEGPYEWDNPQIVAVLRSLMAER